MLLLEWLTQKFPATKRTTLRRMLQAGRVLVNGKPARRAKDPVGSDDRVEVLDRPSEQTAPVPAVKPPFEIVHEDADVIVVLKPPGILTSTGQREKRSTIKQMLHDYVKNHRPRAVVGAIHRLDRDASGLLVFSLNNDAYRNLKRQFFHHTVDRVYTAIVEGKVTPPEGQIENHLIERGDGRVIPTKKPGEGQMAITHYQTVATRRIAEEGGDARRKSEKPRKRSDPGSQSPRRFDQETGKDEGKRRTISLMRITLQTGRKHQIRAQFAARSHPVIGDRLYSEREPTTRLLLAATELAFDHPRTGERMKFSIKPPKEILALFPTSP